MSNVLVYAINNHIGGGKSILDNFLITLDKDNYGHNIFILAPNLDSNYNNDQYKNLSFLSVHKFFYTQIGKLLFTLIFVNFILKKYKITTIINLTDIQIPNRKINQLFLFDWPYGVEIDKRIWDKLTTKEFLIRRFKKFLFDILFSFPDYYLVQTYVLIDKLKLEKKADNFIYFPNSTNISYYNSTKYSYLSELTPIKLLFFSSYYTHKNFEILIPLTLKLKENFILVKFILTLNESDERVINFFTKVKNYDLCDYFLNIGVVKIDDISSLYTSIDALFLPTLLESFSGTYIEAIYFKRPIITSNLDFAKEICSKKAYYFDPYNVNSIFRSIINFIDDHNNNNLLIIDRKDISDLILNWNINISQLIKYIK